jgi:hypothetical protein
MPKVRLPNGTLLNFPEDTSEEVMRDAIYKNFPEYSSKITEEPKMSGFSGILSDIGKSVSSAPGAIVESFKQLPRQFRESLSQVRHDPLRALENIGAGIGEAAKGMYNAPLNVAEYLGEKEIPYFKEIEPLIKKMQVGDTGLEKTILGEERPGDELLQAFSSFFPYAKLGGAGKGLKGIARRAGATSAYAAGQKEDPIIASLMGLAGEGLAKGAKGYKSLAPSRMFRGELTPEQLESNLRASEGTKTPLGSVLQEPRLKSLFENITSQIPFSGAKNILGEVKKEVEDRGENLIKKLEPEGIEGDTNELVKTFLDTAYKENKIKKNQLYNKRNELAEKEKHNLDLSNFNKLASEASKSIEESPLLQNDPDFRRAYNKLLGFKETSLEEKSPILNISGKPIISKSKSPSISDATLTVNTLYDEGEKLKASPLPKDRSLGDLFKNMSKTLRNDIESSIEKTGSEELKSSHKEAKENYKKNFSQFLDKNVYKHLSNEKEPQKIVHEIIKPGAKQDQYKDIEKINKLLPEDQKNLLGYTYLKGAENKSGEIDPKKLASLVNSLGNRQFKALFPDTKTRQEILDYGKLRGMNEEALNILHNPKTGFRNLQSLMTGAQGALLGTGNPFIAAAPTAFSYAMNKALTSPKLRESLVKKMIKESKKVENKGNNKLTQTLKRDDLFNPLFQSLLSMKKKKGDNDGIR